MIDREDLSETEAARLDSVHSHLLTNDECTRIKLLRQIDIFDEHNNLKETLDNLTKLTAQIFKVCAYNLMLLQINICN